MAEGIDETGTEENVIGDCSQDKGTTDERSNEEEEMTEDKTTDKNEADRRTVEELTDGGGNN